MKEAKISSSIIVAPAQTTTRLLLHQHKQHDGLNYFRGPKAKVKVQEYKIIVCNGLEIDKKVA